MFAALPDVLQDIVLQFAFKINKKEMESDFNTILEIKQWKLHPCFLRHRVFLSDSWSFQDNPLEIYFPLRGLSSMYALFDMCIVYDFLERLDFRRTEVRCMGSRIQWMETLELHWEFIGLFSIFFNRITPNPDNLKPMWQGLPLFV
jgi:hypothetical protein